MPESATPPPAQPGQDKARESDQDSVAQPEAEEAAELERPESTQSSDCGNVTSREEDDNASTCPGESSSRYSWEKDPKPAVDKRTDAEREQDNAETQRRLEEIRLVIWMTKDCGTPPSAQPGQDDVEPEQRKAEQLERLTSEGSKKRKAEDEISKVDAKRVKERVIPTAESDKICWPTLDPEKVLASLLDKMKTLDSPRYGKWLADTTRRDMLRQWLRPEVYGLFAEAQETGRDLWIER